MDWLVMHIYICVPVLITNKAYILFNISVCVHAHAHMFLKLLYKMNIWQQFNLANQSFLSDWQILYW